MLSGLKRFYSRYQQAVLTVLFVLVLGGGGFGAYAIFHHKSSSGLQQVNQVTAEVGKLIILPNNETPTLATVTDKSKLQSNSILAKADNGDKLLIYLKNQEVILYRPSAHKIVAVGPVITGSSSSPYVTSSFEILNGSGNDANTQKMVGSVLSSFPNAQIVDKEDAPRTFPNTIIIASSSSGGPLAETIADALHIKTGQLPLGINPVSADFLIIIGTDQNG